MVSTLRYAAQLRLPSTTTREQVHQAVDEALQRLDLAAQRDLRVSALSGGQRKRASIAVELLTDPHVVFLDEPTSGLDPATSSGLLANLRRLANSGATIVLTTHAVQDLTSCDRVLFLASGGQLAFAGSIREALDYFDAAAVEDIYVALAEGDPADWAARWRDTAEATPTAAEATGPPSSSPRSRPGGLRQFTVLTRRAGDTLVRNRLTLAILLGSPAMVVAMFTVLFRPGAFVFAHPTPPGR